MRLAFSDLEQGLLMISLQYFMACSIYIRYVFACICRAKLFSCHTAFQRPGFKYPGKL